MRQAQAHSGGSSPNVMLTSMPCLALRAFQTKYQMMPAAHAPTNRMMLLPVVRRVVGSMNE